MCRIQSSLTSSPVVTVQASVISCLSYCRSLLSLSSCRLKGIRIFYSKICHFGWRSILSCRHVRFNDSEASFSGALPWLKANTLEKWGLPWIPSPGGTLWPWRRWKVGTQVNLHEQMLRWPFSFSFFSFHHIFTSPHFAGPGDLKSLFLCLVMSWLIAVW